MDESFQIFLQRSSQFLRFVFDEFFLGGEICIFDKEIKNFQRILLIVENLQYCPKKHFHPCKTTGPCCLSTDVCSHASTYLSTVNFGTPATSSPICVVHACNYFCNINF